MLYWMQKETQQQRVRKRLRFLMSSFPQPLTVRPIVLRVPTPLSWRLGQGTEWRPRVQRNSDLLYHSDSPKSMGLDGIHPWWLRELAAEIIIYQQSWKTGRSQLTGSQQMWHTPTNRAGRRIWGITGLSICPPWWARLWRRSSFKPSHRVQRTTRGSGPANMGLWQAGSAWLTWSPPMTRWHSTWGKSCGCFLPGPQKSLWNSFSQHPPEETGCPWLG